MVERADGLIECDKQKRLLPRLPVGDQAFVHLRDQVLTGIKVAWG